MPITPPVWFDYDPATGTGDPSTPLSGAGLTSVMGAYNDRVEEAVDAKLSAEDAAALYATHTDIDDLSGEFITRSSTGPVITQHAAVSLPGSPKTGNVVNGAEYVEIQAFGLSNAFPALAKARNGDLVAMWRQATAHGRGFKGDLMLSRSSDLGATWTTPVVAITHATMDYRDPMLTTLSDGRLAVTFFQDDATKAAGVLVSFSSDHGANWSTPTDVPFARAYSNASSGPMVELANGDLLVCGYGAIDSTKDAASRWDVRVMKSTDGGSTWGSSVTIADGFAADLPYSETVMGLLPDGTTLMALIRCDTATKTIYRSTSTDGGATWSAATGVLTNAGGRPSWISLSSGGVLLTYRRSSDTSAELVTSWDSGATWSTATLLDGITPSQSVYQQPVEISAGLVGVVYAEEESATSSRVRVRFLMDGYGFSPLGDHRLPGSAAPTAWTAITPAANWRAYLGTASYLPAWRINGDMVEIRPGMLQRTGASLAVTAGAVNAMTAAIDVSARPPTNGYRGGGGVHLTSNTPALAECFVDAAGVLNFISGAAGTLADAGGSSYVAVPYLTWPVP